MFNFIKNIFHLLPINNLYYLIKKTWSNGFSRIIIIFFFCITFLPRDGKTLNTKLYDIYFNRFILEEISIYQTIYYFAFIASGFIVVLLPLLIISQLIISLFYLSFAEHFKTLVNYNSPKAFIIIPIFLFFLKVFINFKYNTNIEIIVNLLYIICYFPFIYTYSRYIEQFNYLFKKTFIAKINITTGLKPFFNTPENLIKRSYQLLALNTNYKTWSYIPPVLLLNNKGIYLNKQYFSYENIENFNETFNKKFNEYTKEEFETFKMFNFK